MSFFDDASLAFLPSGGAGKDGKAYSIKPTDGTGDFTFSRGSNLTATRVGPTGLIEKGRENLLTYSNQFDTTWSASGLNTPTTGYTGYDGSSDAWELDKSGTGGAYLVQSVSGSGMFTTSVYAKRGSLDYLLIWVSGGAAVDQAYFELLDDGAVTQSFNTPKATINRVGTSDWYRCEVICEGVSAVRFYPAVSGSSTSGTSGNIYIQDAQLELGLAATDYIESGATTGKAGLLENEPRFDYSGGATCPSLLLEPQRVQLVPQSEYITIFSNVTSTYNTTETLSPEGLYNAIKAEATGSNPRVRSEYSASDGVYTLSLFAKEGTSSYLKLRAYDRTNNHEATFDLTDGTFSGETTGVTAYSEDYGNGWYRCAITYTSAISDTGLNYAQAYVSNGSTGNIYVYGYQAEEGSYPTSYIPNHSGGSATRTGDAQTLDITNFVSATEGTLFFELKDARSHSATNKILGIGDGSGVDNFFGLYVSNFETGTVGIRNRQANADLMNTAIPNPQNAKVAIKFGASGVKTFLNGSEFQSSATAYTGWATSFDLNTSVGDVDLKQYLLFDTALSDADCIALTT